MNRLFAFCSLLCSTVSLWRFSICQQTQLQSEVRITKLYNCNTTRLKWNLENATISYSYPRSYINGALNITEDTKKIKKVIVHLDRCIDHGYTCEDFQTWHIDNFCPILKWKNQLWSGITDAVHPLFHCPFKKMIYQVQNGTYDLNVVTRWYPEFADYYWITKTKIINERDELVYCIIFESYVYQYMKRNRKS